MARRNDHTKDEIRQMAVLAGHKMIKESGFSNFSTRKIAKEIGYTVGTLYHVFDNYDDIILNINAKTLVDMKEFILEKQSYITLEGVDRAKNLARLYIEFVRNNQNIWSAIFEYNIPSNIDESHLYNICANEILLIAQQAVVEIINDHNSNMHTQILWSAIHGICILHLKQRVHCVKSLEEMTDALIENYFAGIKK